MLDHATTSLRTPTPASLADAQPHARHRRQPRRAAYARYVRLHRLHSYMPASHPDYQPLATAVVAANARWRALAPGAGRAPQRVG